jgi:hypothetical protein
MPKLSQDVMVSMREYINLRFNHKTYGEKNIIKKQTIKALKHNPDKVVPWLDSVKIFLAKNGELLKAV